MTALSSERWASLPASGDELTPAEQVVVDRMVENAARAGARLVARWNAADAEQPPS